MERREHLYDGLRATNLSELLAAEPRCLEVLVRHGFTPLRQPALRRVLAPTVDLGQAARIRGLSAEAEAVMLAELAGLLEPGPSRPAEARAAEEVPACH